MKLALIVLALSAPAWAAPKDCRANIRRVTCRVAPMTPAQENDPRFRRACLGGEAVYAAQLEQVYDALPAKLQKMFCHLRRIYVEEEFYATGYAGRFAEVFRDKDGKERVRFAGHVLGLSKAKLFETAYGSSEWLNRKEQTLFGRRMEDPLLTGLIPQFEMGYTGYKARSLLIDVIVHEFGHMLDSAQRFNTYELPPDIKCMEESNQELPECQPKFSGLWSAVGWNPDGSVRAEDRYFDLPPCYYECEGGKLWPVEKAVDIYRAFVNGSAFVSTYASVNPVEDFAESFLFYVSEDYLSPMDDGSKYFYSAITFPGEDPVNLNRRYRGRIRAKMDFMKMFDAMPWKYEAEPYSVPIEDFIRPPVKGCY